MLMMQKTLMNKMVRKGLYRNLIEVDQKIVELSVANKFITTTQMAIWTGKSRQTIATRIRELQEIANVRMVPYSVEPFFNNLNE